jgi:cation diffusion facilitator family transporter
VPTDATLVLVSHRVPLSRKSRAAAASVTSNATLVVLKVAVGALSHSISILSEAIHSGFDLLAAVIAFTATHVADRPSDEAHPYGHAKAESISAAVEATLILLAAIWIVVEAGRKLVLDDKVEHVALGAGVMGFSALVNALVSRYLFRLARQEDSIALEADAHHLATDVYTCAGVGLGLGAVWLTGLNVIDPLVAIAVAVLIARIGWDLTRRAGGQLMDESLPPAELAQIEAVLRAQPKIVEYHRLRTRKSGAERHVDVHLVLPARMSLGEAHDVALVVEQALAALFRGTQVVTHLDPDTVVRERIGPPAD